jgi:surface polysaccharide O-acyltransferase-like enzyme
MKILRSVGAVLAGLILIFVLSTATDELLHATGAMARGPLPMRGAEGLILVLLAYRLLYSIAGCYLTARLAPSQPMRHALALGVIGLIFSSMGALMNSQQSLGPAWYPWALVLLALPCAWLGGRLAERRPRAMRTASE